MSCAWMHGVRTSLLSMCLQESWSKRARFVGMENEVRLGWIWVLEHPLRLDMVLNDANDFAAVQDPACARQQVQHMVLLAPPEAMQVGLACDLTAHFQTEVRMGCQHPYKTCAVVAA